MSDNRLETLNINVLEDMLSELHGKGQSLGNALRDTYDLQDWRNYDRITNECTKINEQIRLIESEMNRRKTNPSLEQKS
jgi:hypothetical protein